MALGDGSDYPTSIDNFADPENKVDVYDARYIADLNDAINKIETELGLTLNGSLTNLSARLDAALAGDGAIAKGTSFPVSPAPVDGQMFYRTDEDTFYIYDGTGWEAFGVAQETFTIAETGNDFTAGVSVNMVYVTMIGGGGGGGGSSTTAGGCGAGGAAGMCLILQPVKVQSGTDYQVDVGAKGTGGAAGNPNGTAGTTGGDTIFDSGTANVTADGGPGGGGANGATGSSGSTNPTVTDHDFDGSDGSSSNAGGTGGDYAYSNYRYPMGGGGAGGNGSNQGGGGGATIWGDGGDGGRPAVAASATSYGAGGGGGSSGAGGAAGADGAPGVCIITW